MDSVTEAGTEPMTPSFTGFSMGSNLVQSGAPNIIELLKPGLPPPPGLHPPHWVQLLLTIPLPFITFPYSYSQEICELSQYAEPLTNYCG